MRHARSLPGRPRSYRFAGRPAISVIAATTAACVQLPQALAQEWFEVNGKRVSKNVYDAALLVNEARKLIQSNCLERATAKLKRAVLLAPDLADARSNLALLLARRGKIEEARAELLLATKIPNAPPTAFLNLATLYQSTGEIEKAIENYEIYIARTGDVQTKAAVELLKHEKDRRRAAGAQPDQNDDYLEQSKYCKRVRWSNCRMPLKVFIDPLSVNPSTGYRESYNNLLRQSFYDWQKASGESVRFFFTSSPKNADIKCYWTNDPQYLGAGAEAGETRLKSTGHALVEATIYLRAKEENGEFPYTEAAVKGTSLHEIGHALGISGHSLDVSDIMFFSIPLSDNERRISTRDCNTLKRLYSFELDWGSEILSFLLSPDVWFRWAVPAMAALVLALAAGYGMRPLFAPKKEK